MLCCVVHSFSHPPSNPSPGALQRMSQGARCDAEVVAGESVLTPNDVGVQASASAAGFGIGVLFGERERELLTSSTGLGWWMFFFGNRGGKSQRSFDLLLGTLLCWCAVLPLNSSWLEGPNMKSSEEWGPKKEHTLFGGSIFGICWSVRSVSYTCNRRKTIYHYFRPWPLHAFTSNHYHPLSRGDLTKLHKKSIFGRIDPTSIDMIRHAYRVCCLFGHPSGMVISPKPSQSRPKQPSVPG